jgi:PAS domain S-box-containing protein
MDLFSDDMEIKDLEVATKLLKQSRSGFLTLFNNSPICMSMTTTMLGKRMYVKVNKKFLEKFGYAEQDIIGRTSVDIGILDAEESVRVGSIIKEKGRLQNDYVKCIAKDGTIVHTVSSIEFMDMNDQTYLVSFFLDITKIIDQQKVIEQYVQQLEAINKELEAFSYSVSHDLRSPLRAIEGYTKMLEEDFYSLFNDEGKRLLSAVQRNTKRMGNLIDSLLYFARLGKKVIQKSDIDMNNMVNEILYDLKFTTDHKAEIKLNTLYPIKGDPELIREVITNLISNSIKYSSKKENPVIEITSDIKDNQVVYSIKDNGEGFDMKYADKLFGVFQRMHSDKEFEGTGIGLATVQRIINKHGGVVYAEAEPKLGATFTFVLPMY